MSGSGTRVEGQAELRERLELEKLSEELAQLKKEPSHWLTRNVLQVAAATLISAGVGLFVSSMETRRQSEIRRDVLSKYLELDNSAVGKRVQMLDFVELVLDDAKLDDWVRSERETLREASSELELRIQHEEQVVASSLAKIEQSVSKVEKALGGGVTGGACGLRAANGEDLDLDGGRVEAPVEVEVRSMKAEVRRAKKAAEKRKKLLLPKKRKIGIEGKKKDPLADLPGDPFQ